jgi:hypothetical protein
MTENLDYVGLFLKVLIVLVQFESNTIHNTRGSRIGNETRNKNRFL